MASFQGYGRVGCFKGFDEESFVLNTKAAPELFARQFELMKRYLGTNIDMYAYTTFTTLRTDNVVDQMKRFVDRLQAVHPRLPLRTVPLQVGAFGVVRKSLGLNDIRYQAIENQRPAIEAWTHEIESRFTAGDRERSIVDVDVRS